MARGNASARPDKQIGTSGAKLQLQLLFANATDERLASFTAPELARMYRVEEREIECMLLAAQAKRRREIAERG